VNGRVRFSVWTPLAALFVVWLAHVSLSYTAASLRCHDVTLGGEILSIDAFRLVMLALTLVAAAVLGALLLMIARRRRAGADGDAQLAGFMGTILAALFAAYLLWSIPHELANTAVC
jgi:peptidoglycan biosynthesis protein MviN/MurJ (putative lipid II flippase)